MPPVFFQPGLTFDDEDDRLGNDEHPVKPNTENRATPNFHRTPMPFTLRLTSFHHFIIYNYYAILSFLFQIAFSCMQKNLPKYLLNLYFCIIKCYYLYIEKQIQMNKESEVYAGQF